MNIIVCVEIEECFDNLFDKIIAIFCVAGLCFKI